MVVKYGQAFAQAHCKLPQESDPSKGNKSDRHTGIWTEETAALKSRDNDEKWGGALSKDNESTFFKQPKERAPKPSFQSTGTNKLSESFFDALSALETREDPAARSRGKRTRGHKGRTTPGTRASISLKYEVFASSSVDVRARPVLSVFEQKQCWQRV